MLCIFFEPIDSQHITMNCAQIEQLDSTRVGKHLMRNSHISVETSIKYHQNKNNVKFGYRNLFINIFETKSKTQSLDEID